MLWLVCLSNQVSSGHSHAWILHSGGAFAKWRQYGAGRWALLRAGPGGRWTASSRPGQGDCCPSRRGGSLRLHLPPGCRRARGKLAEPRALAVQKSPRAGLVQDKFVQEDGAPKVLWKTPRVRKQILQVDGSLERLLFLIHRYPPAQDGELVLYHLWLVLLFWKKPDLLA
jgi:hypothetical protein